MNSYKEYKCLFNGLMKKSEKQYYTMMISLKQMLIIQAIMVSD